MNKLGLIIGAIVILAGIVFAQSFPGLLSAYIVNQLPYSPSLPAACINPSNPSQTVQCSETDNGYNPTQFSHNFGAFYDPNINTNICIPWTQALPDVCVSNTVLREGVCGSNVGYPGFAAAVDIDCPTALGNSNAICSNGICFVPTPPSVTITGPPNGSNYIAGIAVNVSAIIYNSPPNQLGTLQLVITPPGSPTTTSSIQFAGSPTGSPFSSSIIIPVNGPFGNWNWQLFFNNGTYTTASVVSNFNISPNPNLPLLNSMTINGVTTPTSVPNNAQANFVVTGTNFGGGAIYFDNTNFPVTNLVVNPTTITFTLTPIQLMTLGSGIHTATVVTSGGASNGTYFWIV